MAKKRKNGEGSWGEKKIRGVKYKYYRDADGKYFYGKTEKAVLEKKENYYNKKTKVDSQMTLGEYMDWYYDTVHKNSVSPTTYSSYRKMLDLIKTQNEYDIYNVKLKYFTKNSTYIQDYINAITDKYAYNYICYKYKLIKLAIIHAQKQEIVEDGILECVRLPNKQNVGHKEKQIPFLSKSDVEKMYNEVMNGTTLGKKKYGSIAWAVILIIHTGLRIGEAQALKWNDINWETKRLRVDETYGTIRKDHKYEYIIKAPKTKKSNREIPLNKTALEMLELFDAYNPNHTDDDLVCLSRYMTKISESSISLEIDYILKKAGCECTHCNPHGLRHTFGSLLAYNGVPLKTIAELMGHERITTTANIYIGVYDESKESAVKLIG